LCVFVVLYRTFVVASALPLPRFSFASALLQLCFTLSLKSLAMIIHECLLGTLEQASFLHLRVSRLRFIIFAPLNF
jgi:hypothetical protein